MRRVVESLFEMKTDFAGADAAGRENIAGEHEDKMIDAVFCVHHAVNATLKYLVARR